jgi:hypothetical protein
VASRRPTPKPVPSRVGQSTAPSTSARPLVAESLALSALEAFIADEGQISIGHIGPVRGAAVASDAHNMLAALIRRPGETLPQLLMRLDAAVQLALERDCFVDEINHGPNKLLP